MHNIKQIIVTTDFSPESEHAFEFGLMLAKKFGANFDVFHIINLPFDYDRPNLLTYDRTNDAGNNVIDRYPELKERIGNAIYNLQNLAKRINDEGVEGNSHMLTNKTVAQLQKIADDMGAGLVLTGTRGKGYSEFAGSFARKLFNHAKRPVIAVKNQVKKIPGRILFSSDFEDTEELHRAYRDLQELNKAFEAEIHYVRVNTPINFEPTEMSLKYMRLFANRYNIPEDKMHIYNAFSVEEGLCDYARVNEIDMICVFSKGFKGFRRLLHHSVSSNIINYAEIPVLLLRE